MKISIKDLEARLGKKIKRNFSSIGVDTATKTGLGFISVDDEEVDINWSLISFEANSIQELYKQMYKEFGNFIDKYTDVVVVEDVFLGMNPDVTIKLARFGGLAMAQAINNDIPFKTIGAKSARAKLFKLDQKAYKGRTKQAVADYLKSIGIEIDEDNCADGVILAILGIIDGLDFRSNAEIAEERKAQNKLKKKTKKRKK
jgi:Holliday junction resolvasome RuvABC endonuclease subunit